MEETIKKHHIKIKEAQVSSVLKLEAVLKDIKGVKEVTVELDKGDILVEYDLEWCSEADIEKAMQDAGFVLDDSIVEKLKRGWIHYTEENEQDNLHHKPTSCCDVDEIERKRKELK